MKGKRVKKESYTEITEEEAQRPQREGDGAGVTMLESYEWPRGMRQPILSAQFP